MLQAQPSGGLHVQYTTNERTGQCWMRARPFRSLSSMKKAASRIFARVATASRRLPVKAGSGVANLCARLLALARGRDADLALPMAAVFDLDGGVIDYNSLAS